MNKPTGVIEQVADERLDEMIAGMKLYADMPYGIKINEFSAKDIYSALVELKKSRQCDQSAAPDKLICPKCASDEVYYENAKTGAGCYVCQYCEHEGNEDDFKGHDQVSILSELLAELEESGIGLIAKERERQINKLGYTADHDRQYIYHELAMAAICYAIPEDYRDPKLISDIWPWDSEFWKPDPDNRKREIIKACALLMAEYDRLEAMEGAGKQ